MRARARSTAFSSFVSSRPVRAPSSPPSISPSRSRSDLRPPSALGPSRSLSLATRSRRGVAPARCAAPPPPGRVGDSASARSPVSHACITINNGIPRARSTYAVVPVASPTCAGRRSTSRSSRGAARLVSVRARPGCARWRDENDLLRNTCSKLAIGHAPAHWTRHSLDSRSSSQWGTQTQRRARVAPGSPAQSTRRRARDSCVTLATRQSSRDLSTRVPPYHSHERCHVGHPELSAPQSAPNEKGLIGKCSAPRAPATLSS